MKPEHASTAGSDAEDDDDDDDFVPSQAGEPSQTVASSSRISQSARKKRANKRADDDGSDDSSDEDNSDAEAELTANHEDIDADELEALKKQREEMVAAAGGEDRLGKRRRLQQNTDTTTQEAAPAGEEADAVKTKAALEWEAIKGSSSAEAPTSTAPTTTSTLKPQVQGQEELISVPSTYKFAGELHTTTKLLPRSHPDAVRYLAQSAAPAAEPAKRPPPPSGSGPRRKKGSSLAAMSAAVTAKPVKLNTLEKSKLDWDQFKGNTANLSQQELDELETQTKGGGKGLGDMKGYLERRDFLDRVKDRTGQP